MILAYNNELFEDAIILEKKIHSIRLDPKRRWKQGVKIHHARGVRSKNYRCFKKNECTGVQDIWIECSNVGADLKLHVWVDGRLLGDNELNKLIRNDGFEKQVEFALYFFPNMWRIANPPLSRVEAVLVHWTNFIY